MLRKLIIVPQDTFDTIALGSPDPIAMGLARALSAAEKSGDMTTWNLLQLAYSQRLEETKDAREKGLISE